MAAVDVTRATQVFTERAFNEWVEKAGVGSVVLYFEGSPEDLMNGSNMKGTARRHALAGRLFLFQRRHPEKKLRFKYYGLRLSERAGKLLKPSSAVPA